MRCCFKHFKNNDFAEYAFAADNNTMVSVCCNLQYRIALIMLHQYDINFVSICWISSLMYPFGNQFFLTNMTGLRPESYMCLYEAKDDEKNDFLMYWKGYASRNVTIICIWSSDKIYLQNRFLIEFISFKTKSPEIHEWTINRYILQFLSVFFKMYIHIYYIPVYI